jgi:tRNA A-37 threonylcarbamoyl transferase component Bud32
MSHSPEGHREHPSPLRDVDRAADRFEQALRAGHRPQITEYLAEVPDALRLPLLAELVCLDFEYKVRDLPVTLDDYFRTFPVLESLSPGEREELEAHARRCDELARTKDHVAPTTKPSAEDPRSIGRFTIAGRLGSGTQADVYLSFHPVLLIPVVIKWHRAPDAPGSNDREHLVREGQILAGLSAHPNLLRVYELGFHEDRPYLVLELVQGQTLDQSAEGRGLPSRQAAELVSALAGAVHSAHEQGVIHQDINPRNVLIDGRGQPRLIDFGLAWFRSPWVDAGTEVRPDAGTPRYLTPEQADPWIGPVGPRTDVFGLGAVLYFLLTGKPLYDGATLDEVLGQAARADYDAAALEGGGIPQRLAVVCRRALARNPQDRFATAADLAAALRAAARPPRLPAVAGLAAVFLAASVGGWLLGQPHRPIEVQSPGLEVKVWRPESRYAPLSEALPVRTGDELQVRFHAPAGLHLGLFSINGQGHLSLLQQYPPQATSTELVYPGPDRTRSLEPPIGTEALLVCGRPRTAPSEAELQAAWDGAAPWPPLDPPGRLLRLRPDHLREEGERPRDFGPTHSRPGADTVARRLDDFRKWLRDHFPCCEALAFRHQ